MQHTLPWACLIPCRIALACTNCSGQFANNNLSPSQTQPVKTSQWSSWHRARPLHWLHLPKDSVLWAALTLGHYGLFCSGKLAQPKLMEAGVPQYIHVRDVTPRFSQGCLHYVHIILSSSKMEPFHLGCPVIIGCTNTPIVWSMQGLVHHPTAPAGTDLPRCSLPADRQ